MKFIITGVARNRRTGLQHGKIRNETIDTNTNSLFTGMTDILSIKRKYESFWNDLNSSSEDIVTVLKVKRK